MAGPLIWRRHAWMEGRKGAAAAVLSEAPECGDGIKDDLFQSHQAIMFES